MMVADGDSHELDGRLDAAEEEQSGHQPARQGEDGDLQQSGAGGEGLEEIVGGSADLSHGGETKDQREGEDGG